MLIAASFVAECCFWLKTHGPWLLLYFMVYALMLHLFGLRNCMPYVKIGTCSPYLICSHLSENDP